MDTNELRKRLARLTAMQQHSTETDRQISEAAESRLAVVKARLDELRPSVLSDNRAAEEYEDLVMESGRLNRVLAPGIGA